MSDPAHSPPPHEPKHQEEVRFLVHTSARRFLLIGMPLNFAVLLLTGLVHMTNESLITVILVSAIFPVSGAVICVHRMVKSGYLILDPRRGKLVISGQSISFDRLENPKVAEREVEFMSTMWQPRRGIGEGLEIAPGKIILFNSGYSRRKLEKIAELLGEMLEEYQARRAARAAGKHGGET